MSGPFGWETFGEYFSEELSATEIAVNPFGPTSVANSPLVQNEDILLPFLDSTTVVRTPTIVANAGQFTQVPVEVVVEPNPSAQFTQTPVEVLVMLVNPEMQATQTPVEVLRRQLYERIQVVYWD